MKLTKWQKEAIKYIDSLDDRELFEYMLECHVTSGDDENQSGNAHKHAFEADYTAKIIRKRLFEGLSIKK